MDNKQLSAKEYIVRYVFNKQINSTLTKDSVKVNCGSRIEGRTRNHDITEALRLRVHDPLWMLARQWQMGEFRGNNAGTAMSVRCSVKEEDCSTVPIEPVTEQINPEIDFMARIEAATYAIDLVRDAQGSARAREFKTFCLGKYPLKWDNLERNFILDSSATEEFETGLNSHLADYRKAYEGKIFDGSAFFSAVASGFDAFLDKQHGTDLCKRFVVWYRRKFKPAGKNNSHWMDEDLCYQVDAHAGGKHFVGDRYQGGRLSWYTFDYDKDNTPLTLSSAKSADLLSGAERPHANEKKAILGEILSGIERHAYATEKNHTTLRNVLSLPSPATFASAPNRRLWQMEDHKVYMGNSLSQQSEGNVVAMKYATMYSNDWMLFPLQTEIGKYITIDKIEVIDTFGEKHVISGNDRAGKKEYDNNHVGLRNEAWQMFTNTNLNDRRTTDVQGLYFVPQLAATVEGKPIEEVKILRDEMANMVWGVEEIVPDGCGDTIDTSLYATQLQTKVNEINEEALPEHEPQTVQFAKGNDPQVIGEGDKRAAYSYLLQSTVPYNWIPFIPQRLQNAQDKSDPFFLGGREMILRRGKMPCYLYENEAFSILPVRPLGTILRPEVAEKVENGKATDWKETPMVIHEEAVQATGIRLTKNYQRARWLNGKTYNWLGIYKRQSSTAGNSGLAFDELRPNE